MRFLLSLMIFEIDTHVILIYCSCFTFQPFFLGRHLEDMGRMEDYLATEKLHVDFTSVRPGSLTNDPPTG